MIKSKDIEEIKAEREELKKAGADPRKIRNRSHRISRILRRERKNT